MECQCITSDSTKLREGTRFLENALKMVLVTYQNYFQERFVEGLFCPEGDGRSPLRSEHRILERGNPKKKAIAYLREYPGVTNKSRIARELQMDRSTVRRYL